MRVKLIHPLKATSLEHWKLEHRKNMQIRAHHSLSKFLECRSRTQIATQERSFVPLVKNLIRRGRREVRLIALKDPSLEAERIHIVVVGHTLQKVSLALAPADVVE